MPGIALSQKAPHYWHGSNVSLGVNANTGNVDSFSFNAGVNLTYTRDKWLDNGTVTAQYGEQNKQLNQRKYFLQNQLDYAFNAPRTHFVFINNSATVDAFSAYDYQLLLATGYGHDLIRRKNLIWSVQLGPGFRRNVLVQSKAVEDDALLQTASTLTWQITPRLKFVQSIQANLSKRYNYYKSQTQLDNTLMDNVALSLSIMAEHYTALPPRSSATKLTNTATELSLIYDL